MIKYVLKQNNNAQSAAFGKFYAYPVVEETTDLEARVFKINNLYATSMLSYISVNQRKTSQKRSRYSSIRTFLRLLLLINELVLKNGLG